MATPTAPPGFNMANFANMFPNVAPGGIPATTSPYPTNPNPFLNFIQSPGGSSIISGVLGGIGALGQQRSNEQIANNQLAQQGQNSAYNMQQAIMQDQLARAQGLTQAAPTGWAQNYEQQTLLKNIMLQNLLNGGYQLTPTNQAVADKLKAIAPQTTATIPDEWKTANPFGVNQTMQSLLQRQGVLDNLSGGQAPGMDFTQMGMDPTQAGSLNDQETKYRQYQQQLYNQNLGGNRNVLAGVNMPRPGTTSNNSGSGGNRTLGVLGGAAGGALTGAKLGSFIPGVGNLVGAGIGAAVGGLTRAFGGGPSVGQQIQQQGGVPINYSDFVQQSGNQGLTPANRSAYKNALQQQLGGMNTIPQQQTLYNPYGGAY